MRSVCVFCGSSPGTNPAYADAARVLGTVIASRGLRLVYGGGKVGLMGVVADAVMQAGGRVTGVIPEHLLDAEVGHLDLDELHVVSSMHERKALMADLSDGFIAMPGGYGTLEEIVEVLTWSQLALHTDPVAFLDIAGFWTPLFDLFRHMTAERFVRQENLDLFLVGDDPSTLLDAMATWRPQPTEKWLDLA